MKKKLDRLQKLEEAAEAKKLRDKLYQAKYEHTMIIPLP